MRIFSFCFLILLQIIIQVSYVAPKSFEVCNLDLLEASPSIIDYMSEYCKSLISNVNAKEEAKLFGEYAGKLNELEAKVDPSYNPQNPDGSIPAKLWALRKKMHEENNYFDCVQEVVPDEFYKCLANRRRKMIQNISAHNTI